MVYGWSFSVYFGSVIIDDQDAIKALKNVDDKGKSTGTSVESSFSKIGNAAKVAGALIAAGFTAVLASGINGAMEAEEAVAQLDAVLASTDGAAGMTKDSLLELADGFEKTTKFSAESAMAAESMLLTFTNIGKDVFPEVTQTALDMATALGGDASSQAQALGKALNDPIAGISKLTKQGVVFTDEQKAQITAMAEAGDVAGAQAVMLAELQKEFGGSAEAAGGTFAGKLEILKNAFGNVTESVVTGLMPYLQSFADWAIANMPTIQAAVDTALTFVSNAIKFAGDNANILLPILGFLLGGFVALKVISLLTAIMAAWTTVVTIATAIGTAFGAVLAFITSPIGLIVLAIAALIAVGVLLYQNWGTVQEIAIAVFTAVKDFIGGICTSIGNFFVGLWQGIQNVFSGVTNWFSGIFTGAWNGIKNAFSAVGNFFSGIWNTIKNIFSSIGSAIGDTIGNAFKSVVNSVINFAEKTINGFIKAINSAIGMINKIPGVSIGKLNLLDIPQMEEGGVLKKGQTGYLEGNGDEAVVPLEKNTGWMDKVASKIAYGLNAIGSSGAQLLAPSQESNSTISEELTKALAPMLLKMTQSEAPTVENSIYLSDDVLLKAINRAKLKSEGRFEVENSYT